MNKCDPEYFARYVRGDIEISVQDLKNPTEDDLTPFELAKSRASFRFESNLEFMTEIFSPTPSVEALLEEAVIAATSTAPRTPFHSSELLQKISTLESEMEAVAGKSDTMAQDIQHRSELFKQSLKKLRHCNSLSV